MTTGRAQGVGGLIARAPMVALGLVTACLVALAASAAPVDALRLQAMFDRAGGFTAALSAALLFVLLSPLYERSAIFRVTLSIGLFFFSCAIVFAGWAFFEIGSFDPVAGPLFCAAVMIVVLILLLLGPAFGARTSLGLFVVVLALTGVGGVAIIGFSEYSGLYFSAYAAPVMALGASMSLMLGLLTAAEFSWDYADTAIRREAAGHAANVGVLRGGAAAFVLCTAFALAMHPGAGADAPPPPGLWRLVAVGAGLALLTGCFGAAAGFALAPLGERFIEAENLRRRAAARAFAHLRPWTSMRTSAAIVGIAAVLAAVTLFETEYAGVAPLEIGLLYAASGAIALLAFRSLRTALATMACLALGGQVAAFVLSFAPESMASTLAGADRLAVLAPTALTSVLVIWLSVQWRRELRRAGKASDAAARAMLRLAPALGAAAGVGATPLFAFAAAGEWIGASQAGLAYAVQAAATLIIAPGVMTLAGAVRIGGGE
ncbi:MAG: hypothetical protein AAGC95_09910 [Pseudomonadota bacterium]